MISKPAKASVFIFLGALLVIVGFAFCQMIHVEGGETLAKAINLPKMNICIQIIMLTAAAANIMFCKASPKKAVAGAVWQSGMVAVVAIYGIAWLADTYFGNYMDQMKLMLTDLVSAYPWSIWAYSPVSTGTSSSPTILRISPPSTLTVRAPRSSANTF